MGIPEGTTPEETPGTDSPEGEEQLFDVNGEMIPKSEVIKGYMRQSDYTKKTQDLAKERDEKKPTQSEVPDDEATTKKWLKDNGFVTQEELENHKAQARMESQFDNILENNPNLKKNEKAIRDLQKSSGKSFEEIVIEYGFTTSDKLAKAKDSRDKMVGTMEGGESKPKSLTDLSPEEYAKWKNDNGITGGVGNTLRGAK